MKESDKKDQEVTTSEVSSNDLKKDYETIKESDKNFDYKGVWDPKYNP